jgi:rubrerythrin
MTAFRPFDEKGTPIEEQAMSWKELVTVPYDKKAVDPHTRTRVILMNGIENNATLTKHAIARLCPKPEVKKALAITRRVDSMQQQAVNWMNPAQQTITETTLGFEQVAVDLTANLAQNEEDAYQKATLDFALLEDFDHLYRYAFLYQQLEGGDASKFLKDTIDIKEGRPTRVHHRHPSDEMRRSWDKNTASPKTKMNYFTIVSAEQQTELFYKSHGQMYEDELARGLYTEIADVEEQHVTLYESLGDGSMTPLEMNFLMEVNEAYNYWSCAQTESDPRFRQFWEEMMRDEIGHVRSAMDLLQRFENKDPEKVLGGDRIEVPIVFEETKGYVNRVLEEQRGLQPYNMEYMPEHKVPKDWPSFAYRDRLNGRWTPSEVVVSASGGRGKERVKVQARQR